MLGEGRESHAGAGPAHRGCSHSEHSRECGEGPGAPSSSSLTSSPHLQCASLWPTLTRPQRTGSLGHTVLGGQFPGHSRTGWRWALGVGEGRWRAMLTEPAAPPAAGVPVTGSLPCPPRLWDPQGRGHQRGAWVQALGSLGKQMKLKEGDEGCGGL